MSTSGTTADRILDIAYELITRRGYGGFSFADIAKELSITKPAIPYHYPSKADLVVATTQRHRRLFALALDDITAATTTADDRLHGYVELFARDAEFARRPASADRPAGNQQRPALDVNRTHERAKDGGGEHPPARRRSQHRSRDACHEERADAELRDRERAGLPDRDERHQGGRGEHDPHRM